MLAAFYADGQGNAPWFTAPHAGEDCRLELPAVSRAKRKAFAAVELLVVIGIIALLIGIP